jgi:hypothetical protein
MTRPIRLSPKQAEALRNRVRPMLHFLLKCKLRLEALNFDEKGALFQAVVKAHRAMHGLHVELIYMSCGLGVGEPTVNQPEPTSPKGQVPDSPKYPDS